jgi:hypothetical protein
MTDAIAKEKDAASKRRRIKGKGGKDGKGGGASDSDRSPASSRSDALDEPVLKKVRGRPKKKANAASPVVAKGPEKSKRAKAARGEYKPSFSCEWSRFQFLCRTGRKGDASVTFPFADFENGIEGAHVATKKWLAGFKKKHGLS